MILLKKNQKEEPVAAGELDALVQQERAVAEQIARMEEMIAEAPERIRREYEERRTLMPPPTTGKTASAPNASTPTCPKGKSATSIATRLAPPCSSFSSPSQSAACCPGSSPS